MKKLFTLIAAAMFATSMFAQISLGIEEQKYLGTNYWYNALNQYFDFSNSNKNATPKAGAPVSIHAMNGRTYLATFNGYWNVDLHTGEAKTNNWVGAFPKVQIGYTQAAADKNGYKFFTSVDFEYMTFDITDVSKFQLYLTGNGSNANDVDVVLINKANGQEIKTFPVAVPAGKNNTSTSLVVDQLDPTQVYTVRVVPSVTTALFDVKYKDEFGDIADKWVSLADLHPGVDFTHGGPVTINVTDSIVNVKSPATAIGALHLWNNDYSEVNPADLKARIMKAINDETYVGLEDEDQVGTYTLNDTVNVGQYNLAIYGNDAKVKFGPKASIVAKKQLYVNMMTIDASETENGTRLAPFSLANATEINKADSANLGNYTLNIKVNYTAKEVEDYNTLHATEIAMGILKPITTSDTHVTDVVKPDYNGATQKCFIADEIELNCVNVKSANGLISGGTANWNLSKLTIYGSRFEATTQAKDAVINFVGANGVRELNITNSTFVADSITNNNFFIAFTNGSNAQASKVYGTGKVTLDIENSTFVNVASNCNFLDQYATSGTYTCKNNIFANVKKVNSSISFGTKDNNLFSYDAKSTSDKSDLSKLTGQEETEAILGLKATNTVPTAKSIACRDNIGDKFTNIYNRFSNATDVLTAKITEAEGQVDVAYTQGYNTNAITAAQYQALVKEINEAKMLVINTPNASTAKTTEIATLLAEYDKLVAAQTAFKNAVTTGVAEVVTETAPVVNNRAYNLAGQRVNANAKGIVIINGKKYFNK